MKKPAAKAKPTGVIKENAVSQYIKKATGLRVRVDAVTKFMADFDAVIVAVVDEAKALAQAERRNTILKVDVAAALEKHLRRKDLPWDETAKEVIKHNPTDLGKISKAVRDWIREHEERQPPKAARSASPRSEPRPARLSYRRALRSPEAQAGQLLAFALETMAGNLRVGRRVYFRDFGAFVKRIRPDRRVRHPRTGEII